MRYGFIGCGNMGGAVARAVCRGVGPENVVLANRTPAKAEALAEALGCRAATNDVVAQDCDVIFLGVKPQMMADMLAGIAPILAKRSGRFVLVTMAAGLSMARVREMAGGAYPIIRIMPNTPVSLGAGMIQYCADGVSDDQMFAFLGAMAPAGRLDAIPENLIDAACCVSGCGPAWVYQFIEALADGGVAAGLPRAKAQEYAAQTLLGSARMVLESGSHPGVLKDAVCSPGGSTIQGVRVLEEHAFRGAVTDAVLAAYDKTKEMGEKLMRIVVKIGTSTLAHPGGRLNIRHTEALVKVWSDIKNAGHELIIVSSGATGLGVGKLQISRPKDMVTKQAAAAVGQCELMYTYDKLFAEYSHTVAQLLVTWEDFDHPHRLNNLQNTLERLIQLGAVPVINENDPISTEEYSLGDNDRLGALIAKYTHADLLVLLSDIDGLYTADPHTHPEATLIHRVESVTPEIEQLGGGSNSGLGTGGMSAKLTAAKIATGAGVDMVIANGANANVLYDIVDGKDVGTRFVGKNNK